MQLPEFLRQSVNPQGRDRVCSYPPIARDCDRFSSGAIQIDEGNTATAGAAAPATHLKAGNKSPRRRRHRNVPRARKGEGEGKKLVTLKVRYSEPNLAMQNGASLSHRLFAFSLTVYAIAGHAP